MGIVFLSHFLLAFCFWCWETNFELDFVLDDGGWTVLHRKHRGLVLFGSKSWRKVCFEVEFMKVELGFIVLESFCFGTLGSWCSILGLELEETIWMLVCWRKKRNWKWRRKREGAFNFYPIWPSTKDAHFHSRNVSTFVFAFSEEFLPRMRRIGVVFLLWLCLHGILDEASKVSSIYPLVWSTFCGHFSLAHVSLVPWCVGVRFLLHGKG